MKEKKKVYVLAFLAVLFWAYAFPFTKIAMKYFSPYSLGFTRVVIGSITLLIIGLKAGNRLPKLRDIPMFILSGGCGFAIYLFAFNRGIMTISSSTSSIAIALTPIFTATWASIIYKEKINKIGIMSMLIAFSGVCIIMLQKGSLSINIGVLWTVFAAFVFSIYNILNRKLTSMGYRAIEIVTYSMIASVFELSMFSSKAVEEISKSSITGIVVVLSLGILSSATAYYLWSKALSITKNTSDVTNFGFVTPCLATIMGSIVLGETNNIQTIIGGVLIIGSVIVFAKKGKCNN